jgi:hypothetical protein
MEGPLGNELDLAVHMQLWQRVDITGAGSKPSSASFAQSLYVQQSVLAALQVIAAACRKATRLCCF